MLQKLISIVVAIALASVGFAQEKAKDTSQRELERKKLDDAARALLQKRLPQVNFTNVGMRDAVDFLRDVSGANIYVNWRELKKAGIDDQTLVTFKVKDVTFEKTL